MTAKKVVAPKWPRVQVSPQLHVRLQKAAVKAKVSMTQLADGILAKALSK